jgi:cell division protein FtsN
MSSRQRPDASQGASWLFPFRRVFTIRLSLASLFGICLVSLIGAGWVFAFGVIIGRGFEPDKKLPMLGRLMAPAETAPEAPAAIIKAEDLTFFSDLKTQPTLSTEQPASPSPSKPQEARPADPKKPDKPVAQAQTSPAGGAVGAPPAPQAPEAKVQRYEFVLQVIAYKNAAQADAFREKLENAGLRTRLQTEKDKQGNPRVYRVQVLFRGTDADADQVLATLSRYGAREPVVVFRKPL